MVLQERIEAAVVVPVAQDYHDLKTITQAELVEMIPIQHSFLLDQEAAVVVPVVQQYSMAQQVLMVLEECLEFIMVLTTVKYKH